MKHSPSLGAERPVTKRPRLLVQPGKRLASPGAIQQAKNPARGPQFLQIVAKPERAAARGKPEPKLTRVAFRVSRLMEFCSERELQNQTGHSVYEWPLVVAKELIDNALDACEEAEVAPEIAVIVEPGHDRRSGQRGRHRRRDHRVGSRLHDPGVEPRGVCLADARRAGQRLKDHSRHGLRARSRAAATATAAGVTIIEARGVEHRIEFRVDHVNNQPKIVHTTAPSPVDGRDQVHRSTGRRQDAARIRGGPDSSSSFEAYVWFNPHLTLRGVWFGHEFINVKATNPDWEKWRPRNPTSAHWYDEARLQRYLAAHVARDRDLGQRRTVREFIAEFRGLSGTAVQRKILTEVGCSHQSLAQLLRRRPGQSRRRRQAAGGDEAATASRSRPSISASSAPSISKQRFLAAGGNVDTFKYQCRKGVTDDGIPYVVEFAFGLHQAGL